jgi:ketosteroid isomerase-like protein
MRPHYSLVSAAVLVWACARPTSDGGQIEGTLRTAIDEYRAAINAGDSVTFFKYLADDVEIMAPGAQPARGPAARDMLRPLFTEVMAELAPFTDQELALGGNLAVQRYSYRLTTTPKTGGPASIEVGSGLHIWRRDAAGHWQVVKDIWTLPKTS